MSISTYVEKLDILWYENDFFSLRYICSCDGVQDVLPQNMAAWHLRKQQNQKSFSSFYPFSPEADCKT